MDDVTLSIKTVSKKTGLSTFVIRAWEKRYNVVEPKRTSSNRRLYSAQDIEKLKLLKILTSEGFSIGNIANLEIESLRELTGKKTSTSEENYSGFQKDRIIKECIEAIAVFNRSEFEDILNQSSLVYSQPALIEKLISPLLIEIGELWRKGILRPAQEHFATEIIKKFLKKLQESLNPEPDAPMLLVTTPAGQLHELGALIAAFAASIEGWNILYLGPNLPADDIAVAAINVKVKAVCLSIVYPSDDQNLSRDIIRLGEILPRRVKIIAGGRAVWGYHSQLEKIGAEIITGILELREKLEILRLNT